MVEDKKEPKQPVDMIEWLKPFLTRLGRPCYLLLKYEEDGSFHILSVSSELQAIPITEKCFERNNPLAY